MIGLLERHKVQVLLEAGHTQAEVASFSGISVRAVRRIAGEAAVRHVDEQFGRFLQAIRELGLEGTVRLLGRIPEPLLPDQLEGHQENTDAECSNQDLDLFWHALENMFEIDHSAARGLMSTRQLIVFKHDSALGNAPAHSLFERVTVKRVDESKPAREFKNYKVEINEDNLPPGISIIKRP